MTTFVIRADPMKFLGDLLNKVPTNSLTCIMPLKRLVCYNIFWFIGACVAFS